MLALGSFGAWLLFGRGDGRTTAGAVELVSGARYRFTYSSSRPLTLDEAAELLRPHAVTALSVLPSGGGYWTLSFEGRPPEAARARIGTALMPSEPMITLTEVERLG